MSKDTYIRFPVISTGSGRGVPTAMGTTKTTRNGRSLNIRAPMHVIRTVYPGVSEGTAFEWAAYPELGMVVLKVKEVPG